MKESGPGAASRSVLIIIREAQKFLLDPTSYILGYPTEVLIAAKSHQPLHAMGQNVEKTAENLIISMLNTNIKLFTFACLDNGNSVKKEAGPPRQNQATFSLAHKSEGKYKKDMQQFFSG
jgi:hypothetical protein